MIDETLEKQSLQKNVRKNEWKIRGITWWLKAGLRLDRFSGCAADETFFGRASLLLAVSVLKKKVIDISASNKQTFTMCFI
jgi:hypothetical protein